MSLLNTLLAYRAFLAVCIPERRGKLKFARYTAKRCIYVLLPENMPPTWLGMRQYTRYTQKRLECSPLCFWKYSFVALGAANELSFNFWVLSYVYISILKSICSYLTFQQNKTCLWDERIKTDLTDYLEVVESYHGFDQRFGIYAQRNMYMEVFGLDVGYM